MLHLNNPLVDKDFLAVLDANRQRDIYARIIALTFQEEPVELLEGRVTQGSINVDGASALRRTCSLTLTAQDLELHDYYWGLKSKFKLEIGLKNSIKEVVCGTDETGKVMHWGDKYPQDIIWFPQGIYVITTFNTSQTASNYTVNISGKDKMCFLDGSMGGSLTASIDFGMEEYYDRESNTTTYTPIPIEKIIREAVHAYALEPYHNIIINDLDEIAVELLEYRGDTDTPMYLLRTETDEFVNYTLNGKTMVREANSNNEYRRLDELRENELDNRVRLQTAPNTPPLFEFETDTKKTPYYIAKVEYGQTVGYRYTDLTYAGELISSVGESITSILDKIKNMLGEYEYFYDIDGRFIFQRKKTYIQQTWNNIVKTGDEQYVDSAAYSSASTYRFEDGTLITSFANSPNLANLRNDFSIWGERESVSGAKIPIHYRYAIDKKPTKYTTITITNDDIPDNLNNIPTQISKEYVENDTCDWRELIYLMAQDYYKYSQLDCYVPRLIEANGYDTTGYEQYYIDIYSFWRDIYHDGGWDEKVTTAPDQLNFWFDFLDAHGELGQFSVPVVGDRVKAVNDNNVTAIYFRAVPNLIFTTYNDWSTLKASHGGYTPVFITGGMENLFRISAQGKCAQDKLDELLYNHSYCIESVTIQSVPIYYLQPNTRIFVRDDQSNIQGEYIVSKFTLPLVYNGTMSITATKAPERLY